MFAEFAPRKVIKQQVEPSDVTTFLAGVTRLWPSKPEVDTMADANSVEETFKRLGAHKGVEGIMALTGDGIIIRSTLDYTVSTQYAGWVSTALDAFYLPLQTISHMP